MYYVMGTYRALRRRSCDALSIAALGCLIMELACPNPATDEDKRICGGHCPRALNVEFTG